MVKKILNTMLMGSNVIGHGFRNRNSEIHRIVRHLRTHCLSYLPRGYAYNGIRRTDHAREVETKYDETTAEEKPKAHRDTRSIDSVDPVILKYSNIFNELRNTEHMQEKVYQTNFGSIRFDNDNSPTVHGQYDGVYGPDVNVLMEKKFSDLGIKTNKEGINDETDNDFSHVKKFESHTSTLSPQQSAISVTQDTSEVGRESSTSVGLGNNNDVNYIDDLYFGTAVERYSKTSDKQGEDFSLKATTVSEVDTSELNYIDECVFGDSLSRNSDTNAETANVSQKLVNNDRQQYNAKGVSNDRNDLSYIDKVYFQDSLHTLNENGDPAAGTSEGDDESENYLFDKLKSRTRGKDRDTTVDFFMSIKKRKDITPAIQPCIEQKSEEEEAPDRHVKKEKAVSKPQVVDTLPKSAFEYVVKKRRELHEKSHGIDAEPGGEGRKGLNKILSLLNEKKKGNFTKYEICKLLKNSVIYDKYDVVGLYKPYGMSIHGGGDSPHHVLLDYLPDLARHLDVQDLYPVHRLDTNTTGVLLMARTPAMADTLKKMFKERQLKKTYWAITKGIPSPLQGVIDIPIAEGVIDSRRRMVLTPIVEGLKTFSSNSQLAVTTFRVLAKCNSAAFVELSPMTGVKHQLRVHLGFGLSCPVLGDHKYSHLQKFAPQQLPGDILDHLKLKQSKVRKLPMFLHSRSILLPEFIDGRNITVVAKLPAFFNKAVSFLELNKKQSQMRYDGYRSLD